MASEDRSKPTYKVMLSGTYKELADHRRAVADAMVGQRLLPIAMETDAALPDKDLIAASLSKVDEADAYVGLISYRYGQMPECAERNPQKLSLTELEFRRAVERGLPICMFIMHDEHPVPRRAVGEERGAEEELASFIALAKKDRIYAEFKSIDDLKAKVIQSLIELRAVLERKAKAVRAIQPTASPEVLSNISGAARLLAQLALLLAELALAVLDKVLAALNKMFGERHRLTKASACVTADALDALGRGDDAKALREHYGIEDSSKQR
jgi:hypothetical protein